MSRRRHHGGRFHEKALAGQIMAEDWNDSSRGSEMDDASVCATLGQGHPKSGIPEQQYRPGRALDSTSSATPEPGVGVGGALPIGAFQA